MGDHTPCLKEDCVFYKVPGTRMDCAVQQWAPTAAQDPEVARWFLDLRGMAR
jgi:hypothetical protein